MTRHASAETGLAFIIVGLVLAAILFVTATSVISPGYSGAKVTFGSIDTSPVSEGFHLLNPFSEVYKVDCRQKTLKEEHVPVPSQDQLMTQMDISVQYHLIALKAADMLRETGVGEDKDGIEKVVEVHLIPKLRSLLREVGKGVLKAEDFFNEDVQKNLEAELHSRLADYVRPHGIEVTDVLLRHFELPPVVATAVQAKKQREQLAIQQQAELQRFTVEQQQKIATAEAERKAAEQDAAKTRVLADAEAYKIEALNKAAGVSPTYVQLMALRTLEAMSKDPAAKLYFLDGKSPSPLPLLHLGDPGGK